MNTRTLLLAVTLLFTVSPSLPAQSASKAAAKPAAGRPAPDFTRNTLDGKPLHLSTYRGKLVLLNFWATWCGPCLTEIPRFNTWQTKYAPQGLQVLGVSMDDDGWTSVKPYVAEKKINYRVVVGDDMLAHRGLLAFVRAPFARAN